MINIRSKQGGFRRCGIAHPAYVVHYPDDRFTAEELAILKAEPMLIVREIADENNAESGIGAIEIEAMTGERSDDAVPGIQIGPKDLPPAVYSGKRPVKAGKKGKR